MLSVGGVVVLTGCGTSGRVAHLLARRFNRALPTQPPSFDYLLSGGDSALRGTYPLQPMMLNPIGYWHFQHRYRRRE